MKRARDFEQDLGDGVVRIIEGHPSYCAERERHEPHRFDYRYLDGYEGVVEGYYMCDGEPMTFARRSAVDRPKRAHIYLTWEQLARVLGLKGRPIKVYSEPDNDYLHIFLESDDPDVDWENDGFLLTTPGGYVEGKSLSQVVKDPDILRRSQAAEAPTDAKSV